jgi:hypothetical protein
MLIVLALISTEEYNCKNPKKAEKEAYKKNKH